jgi:zinc protease
MNTSMRVGALYACLLLLALGSAIGQQPDRTKPPEPGPPPTFHMAPIHHATLQNGLPLLLVEKHDVPIVQINLLVNAGSAMDPEKKSGLASLTAAMMMEGAGERNALQLADAIDYLGATITSTAGQHAMAVRLHTPVARLDSALALFADVALKPAFPPEELNRKRAERLTALFQWRDEPAMLASIEFNRILYGEKHSYGVPVIGNERTLNSFGREDLRKFHDSWFRPNNASIIVVGDVKAPAIREKLERVLGTWKPGTAGAPLLPLIEQVRRRSVILVNKPDAPQTVVRIGRIGVPRMTDDYYAIVVMNTILGGSFTSRLNNNLREQKGYTYGAGSSFSFRPLPGPFAAGASVQTAVTDKALTEFMKELNGIRSPVTEEELTRAKNYVALSYPADFQTVSDIASQMEELVTYRLPDDYVNTYVSRILSVTRADVERVANKYIDPETVAIVLVGDQQQIEKSLRDLHLGPVKIRSIEDVLGKPPVIKGTN